MPSTGENATLRVIVFSKDRAFQLKQYLRTLLERSGGAAIDVHVLFRVEPMQEGERDFAASYQSVQLAFPTVKFVREVDFAAQVIF